MTERQRVLMLSSISAALIDLTAVLTDHLGTAIGIPLFLIFGGAAGWFWWSGSGRGVKKDSSPFEAGLRVTEKPFDNKKANLAHGLEVIVRTEARVALGLRLVTDTPIYEVDPVAQTGRGPDARRRVPKTVRESRQSWLFIVSNSAREIETILKVSLVAAQPIHLTRVELIKAGEIAASMKEPPAPVAETVPGEPAAPPAELPSDAGAGDLPMDLAAEPPPHDPSPAAPAPRAAVESPTADATDAAHPAAAAPAVFDPALEAFLVRTGAPSSLLAAPPPPPPPPAAGAPEDAAVESRYDRSDRQLGEP